MGAFAVAAQICIQKGATGLKFTGRATHSPQSPVILRWPSVSVRLRARHSELRSSTVDSHCDRSRSLYDASPSPCLGSYLWRGLPWRAVHRGSTLLLQPAGTISPPPTQRPVVVARPANGATTRPSCRLALAFAFPGGRWATVSIPTVLCKSAACSSS